MVKSAPWVPRRNVWAWAEKKEKKMDLGLLTLTGPN
jgi:hypothetical protein